MDAKDSAEPKSSRANETEEDNTIEIRKDRIKKLIKDNENLLLILLLGFTIIFRLYYFFKLGNQPIWWDEGDYLAIAKVWALNLPTPEWMAHFTGMRPLFLPLLWTLFFKIGFGESLVRFFTLLLPSIGSVYVLYLLGRDMYSKKVGLAAGMMLSTYWVWNFYSFRLLTDIPAVFFGLLSFYFFWSWYEKQGKPKGLYLSMLFGVLAFSTRFPYALVPVTSFAYLFITRKFSIFKDKTIWKAVLLALILLLPYLIYLASINFAPLQFYFGEKAVSIKNPIQWNLIPMSFSLLHGFWLILSIIGLVALAPLFLGFDLVWKQKDKSMNPSLLLVLWMLIHFLFYIAIIRAGNDRWLLMITMSLFILGAKGMVLIYEYVKKYSKIVGIIIALIILLGGAYQNIAHSVDLIEGKKTSYIAVREAGLWLRENTPQNARIITPSIVQNQYYSERDSYDLFYNNSLLPEGCMDLYGATVVNDSCQKASEELFNEKVAVVKPDYYVISVYEPVFTPQWAYSYPQRNNLAFINAFFQPENQQQAVLVIYKFPEDFIPVAPGESMEVINAPDTANSTKRGSTSSTANSTSSNISNFTK